jgi:hypothetical protein
MYRRRSAGQPGQALNLCQEGIQVIGFRHDCRGPELLTLTLEREGRAHQHDRDAGQARIRELIATMLDAICTWVEAGESRS